MPPHFPANGQPAESKGAILSEEDLKAELGRLRQEHAALKEGVAKGATMKVKEKGAVSMYGL